MTRETKVGLLVGMGVILLIGIIVSDQLSSIQHQDAADLTDFAADSQQSIAPLGAAEPRVDSALDTRPSVLTPPGSTSPLPASASDPVDVPPEFAAPPVSSQREARSDSVLQQMAMRTDTIDPPAPVAPIDPTLVERTTSEAVIPLNDVPTIALDQPRADDLFPRAATITPTSSTTKGKTHVVAEGESLYRIAQQYLGNGNDWKKIADANPGKVTADGQVRAGVELTIPGTTTSTTTEKPAENKPATTPTAKPNRTYTVKSGDTLYSIAASQMGNGGKWDELFKANKDQLKNPDTVREGMTLKIPG